MTATRMREHITQVVGLYKREMGQERISPQKKNEDEEGERGEYMLVVPWDPCSESPRHYSERETEEP